MQDHRSKYKRCPRGYDGPGTTLRLIQHLLPHLLRKIGESYQERPDLVLAAWPAVIGARLAHMTEAISFYEGFLTVKVNNSALYSLLVQKDKLRLIQSLRDKFPQIEIKTIIFRLS